MPKLTTSYLGLSLKNPIIVGASNLVTNEDNLEKLERAGAAAIVYKSLFEEQIQLESHQWELAQDLYSHWDSEYVSMFPKVEHAGPAEHLLALRKARQRLSIPLIGSLNAVLNESWVEYAAKMEETGIDALELNFYTNTTDYHTDGEKIVAKQLDVLKLVRDVVTIPIAVKLSPFYTNTLSVIGQMDAVGADGYVLFNRLFQPDIDIMREEHHYPYNFSSENDNRLALRYAGLLYGNVGGSLCANTGIFTGGDVVKMILAGADAVQVVSTIYKKGISHLEKMLEALEEWMDLKHYKSLDDFRGKLSKQKLPDPFAYKRAQYVDILMKSDVFMQYHPKQDKRHLEWDEL
jgi:dihydroorotate dehydrogenase (fumarate)